MDGGSKFQAKAKDRTKPRRQMAASPVPGRPIDLSQAGWPGWTFGPYGRAREWRLFGPDGTNYTAEEIRSARGLLLDVDYLRSRVRGLQEKIDAHACHFSASDLEVLQAAMVVLAERLPAPSRSRRLMTSKRASLRLVVGKR